MNSLTPRWPSPTLMWYVRSVRCSRTEHTCGFFSYYLNDNLLWNSVVYYGRGKKNWILQNSLWLKSVQDVVTAWGTSCAGGGGSASSPISLRTPQNSTDTYVHRIRLEQPVFTRPIKRSRTLLNRVTCVPKVQSKNSWKTHKPAAAAAGLWAREKGSYSRQWFSYKRLCGVCDGNEIKTRHFRWSVTPQSVYPLPPLPPRGPLIREQAFATRSKYTLRRL